MGLSYILICDYWVCSGPYLIITTAFRMILTCFPLLWVEVEGKPFRRLVYFFPSLHVETRPRVGNGGAEYSRNLSMSEAKIAVTSASWPFFHLLLLLTYYTILGPKSRTLSAAIYRWPWTWTTRACPDSRARLRLRTVFPGSFWGVCVCS